MMRFEIFNVEHGFCAYAQGADGRVMLFDCGSSTERRPSRFLPAERGIRSIHQLFITNYDEDHISDLLEVDRSLGINILAGNRSLSTQQIRSLKTPPISEAMDHLLGMIDSYTLPIPVEDQQPQGIMYRTHWNDYPNFTDTNNLSLLTFLDIGSISFVISGDLERAGWLELLKKPHVRGLLRGVNIFIASHHGRESGYCREVFEYCRPSLIVMSDGPIQYDTQQMAGTYAQHASGAFFTTDGEKQWRKVVTTRRDGDISWEIPHVRKTILGS